MSQVEAGKSLQRRGRGETERPLPRRWRQKAPRECSGLCAFANGGPLQPELDRYPIHRVAQRHVLSRSNALRRTAATIGPPPNGAHVRVGARPRPSELGRASPFEARAHANTHAFPLPAKHQGGKHPQPGLRRHPQTTRLYPSHHKIRLDSAIAPVRCAWRCTRRSGLPARIDGAVVSRA